jgi:hypothetical protein
VGQHPAWFIEYQLGKAREQLKDAQKAYRRDKKIKRIVLLSLFVIFLVKLIFMLSQNG